MNIVNLLNQKLQSRVRELKEENKIYNIPEFYRNDNCSDKNYYVAEYPNGDKKLVKVFTDSGRLVTLHIL